MVNHVAISLDDLCVSLLSDDTIVTIGDPLSDGNSSDLGHF